MPALVLAEEITRAARRADRAGDRGLLEKGAFAREPIDVRCFHEGISRQPERAPALIVGEDEDDVGLARGGGAREEQKERDKSDPVTHGQTQARWGQRA